MTCQGIRLYASCAARRKQARGFALQQGLEQLAHLGRVARDLEARLLHHESKALEKTFFSFALRSAAAFFTAASSF